MNDPDVLAAEVPAANGVCTARALAGSYAALIGPGGVGQDEFGQLAGLVGGELVQVEPDCAGWCRVRGRG